MKKIPFLTDILATGFYMGKIPFMPGTFGSLAAIPIGFLCTFLSVYFQWVVFALIFFLGVYVSGRYSILSGMEDPGCVVIDEVAGLLLFYIIFPFKPVYILAGFILFRFFDILKPFPVSFFDRIKNGWGIMLDDIAAGLYAAALWFIVIKILEYYKIAL